MTLRLLHRVYGVVVVLVFLGTGQYMLHRHPAMTELAANSRMLYRSAHIYLVMSGLLNLAVGAYIVPRRLKWLQWAGSIFLVVAPALLFAGFCRESIQPGIDRPLTSSGVYLAFAGVLLHFAASFSPGP
ncbi:MAG TPA: hypothetical protein VLR94_04500 [Acidobacteriota bacterium]|nr:hypothetical protein [Acidobacteriota bacterium]